MRWAVLGPLLVSDDSGREVRVPGSRLRTLLAALLLRANEPVGVDELCDALWNGAPPPDAARTVRVYVLRLRRALGPAGDRIQTEPPGYLCRVHPGELDTFVFQTACGRAAVALAGGSWAVAAGAAERAMRLWRAQPLIDVPSQRLHDAYVPHLERLRLQVLDDRCEADLALGRHGDLIPRLRELVKRHPSYEHFYVQLMVALEGCGRRAEALAAYRQARQALVAELGTEPGAELRALHRRIMDGGGAQVVAGNGDEPAMSPPVVTLESLHAIDEAVERASLTLAAFVTGHFERLWPWLSAPLAEVATVEHLAGAREDLVREMGAFQRMSGMPRVRRVGLRTVVEIPVSYEAAPMKGRVTLDSEGKVLGLYLLRVDEP